MGDASDYVNYGADRAFVDLRTICSRFPAIALPLLINSDEWVATTAGDDGVGAVVVVYRPLPGR